MVNPQVQHNQRVSQRVLLKSSATVSVHVRLSDVNPHDMLEIDKAADRMWSRYARVKLFYGRRGDMTSEEEPPPPEYATDQFLVLLMSFTESSSLLVSLGWVSGEWSAGAGVDLIGAPGVQAGGRIHQQEQQDQKHSPLGNS